MNASVTSICATFDPEGFRGFEIHAQTESGQTAMVDLARWLEPRLERLGQRARRRLPR